MTGKWKAAVLAALLSCTATAPVAAQDFPLVSGDFTEVSMIKIADGGEMEYANYLADKWRKSQEFAKSKGWITGYAVYSNYNSRPGEADLLLTVSFSSLPDAAEEEKRDAAYRAYMQRSDAQLVAESGDRAKYRTILGSYLIRELKFKK